MFMLKLLIAAVVMLALATLLAGQMGRFSGTQPTDLGVHNGRLKSPSQTPNSVSSQASLYPDHPQRHNAEIKPLQLIGDGPKTLARVKDILERMGGVTLIESRPNYLYAQATTKLMKFVDDMEFWYDPANQVIQVRSASRIGSGDFNVNRKRIEAVRDALATS